jgi:hypothetical protein
MIIITYVQLFKNIGMSKFEFFQHRVHDDDGQDHGVPLNHLDVQIKFLVNYLCRSRCSDHPNELPD